MTTVDVLLLGAAGSSGHQVAWELARRGASLHLAGRRPAPVATLAEEIAGTGVMVDSLALDVTDPAAVRAAAGQVRVVVSTVGPFVRYAPAVLDACLATGACYVDIANESTAVRAVLDRDAEAKDRGITAVTGAGFGPAGSESLLLELVEELAETPALVQVATVPANTPVSQGVRDTVAALLPEGATTYVGGVLHGGTFGAGATVLTFGGARRSMVPGPVGDLEAARVVSGAPNVNAYFADPSRRVDGDGFSYSYAEVFAASGRRLAAQARVGDGVAAGAAIAAEVTRRVLAGAPAGAWTPGRLFGAGLFREATGATVTRLAAEVV